MSDFVTIENKKINYKFLNENKFQNSEFILIFLHDGLGSIGQWKDFPENLSDKLNLPALIYDRFGHGKSDIFSEEKKYDFMEREALIVLPEILRQLNISKKIIFIGHSDGATIALMYAAEFPEKTAAVISIAAHVFIEDFTAGKIKSIRDTFAESKLRRAMMKYHSDKTDLLFKSWSDVWLSYVSVRWDITELLIKIISPVLIVQGDKDEFGTLEQVERIYDNVSGIKEKAILENINHLPNIECPELLLEKVYNFLKSILHR